MHSYTVELRIIGENLDPDSVTRTLGISPTQVRKKGERRSDESTWKSNMWALDVLPPVGSEWGSLEDGLAALVSRVKAIQSQIQLYLPANELYVWCGHFTSGFDGGPTLSPNILKSLGDLGAQLFLDTYCESAVRR